MLILYSKVMKNIASLTVLIRFNVDFSQWLTCLGHPLQSFIHLNGDRTIGVCIYFRFFATVW